MLNELKNETNYTLTENGAGAYKTTQSAVLDFFALGGALRSREDREIVQLFSKAFGENALLALKTLFYFRDVREGQGERRTFKIVLTELGNIAPETVQKNINLIPEYGRWDDLYVLIGTKSEKFASELIINQFNIDVHSERPSLLGKWLKSVNSKQKETRKLGLWTAKQLGLSEKEYRKSLSSLREKLDVVERKMVAKEWKDINYPAVPSKAMLNYRKAFSNRDEERYGVYLESLVKGETKVNSSNLYPYELVRTIMGSSGDMKYNILQDERTLVDEMWKALPNYFGEKPQNAMAVIDVSYSMTDNNSLPLYSAIGLGMYISERAEGPYKNHFITFSESPELVEIKGTDFYSKVENISRADWGGSTNLESTFDLILNTAVKHKLSQDELVERLYIITDMEFNKCDYSVGDGKNKFMKQMREKYADEGYTLPEVVFINVNARNTHFPMTVDESGILMVSGMSPTIFTSLMEGKILSAYDMMLKVLETERYSAITV